MFPPHWQPLDWLVPFSQNKLYIHHGHRDAHDHSRCGPLLFCCLLAVEKYNRLAPASATVQAEWELWSAAKLASLLNERARMMYFIFCDPIRPEGLWAIGLEGEALLDVLYKQTALNQLLEWEAVKRLG